MKACPLLQGDCAEHSCRWYLLLSGTDPQTGAVVDRWDCAVAMLPMLLIENTRYARELVTHLTSGNELNKQALRSAALRAPTAELKRMIGINGDDT